MIPGVVRGRRGYQNSSVGVGAPEKTSSILLFAPSEAQVGSSNLAARLLEAGLGACADTPNHSATGALMMRQHNISEQNAPRTECYNDKASHEQQCYF